MLESPAPAKSFRFSVPQILGNLPIRLKLRGILLAAIGTAMLMACVVFFF